MEIDSNAREKKNGGLLKLKEFPGKLKDDIIKRLKNVQKLGKDDPRRIIHSMKVGLALTLVSLLYYVRPLYDSFGVSGIWAVITVVVLFEFTVGGTLSKGLNRGFATLLAGALGVGAVQLASHFGDKGEPIVLGVLVFLLGTAATFSRFFPRIKRRYDYGVLIFILTFSMVAVSGSRTNEILVMAYQRLSTVLIGGAICMLVSIFVCPVWAGEDLHKLVANNIDSLANYLEGFAVEYFQSSEKASKEDKSCLQGYKSVLTSKNNEENLANLARWEPGHGRFRLRHPWRQYPKIGAQTRQCAYQIEILNGYVTSGVKAPQEFLSKIQEPCTTISREAGKALKCLSTSIKTMRNDPSWNSHVENSKKAITDLSLALKSASPETTKELLEIIPAATAASILIDVVKCVEKIAEAVHELSGKAHFKGTVDATVSWEMGLLHRGSVKPVLDGDGDNPPHVVITVDDEVTANGDSPEKKIPEPQKNRVEV